MKQRNCLAHHVTTHQRTVSIVVLQERNESGSNRCNLLRRYVHKVNLRRRHYGEVGVLAALNHFADKRTVVVQRSITLTDDMVFLLFSSKIKYMVIVEINNSVLNLAVRSLDESQLIDFSVNTKRRDKSDVRTFRALNRTKASVVCIVNVTHLETGTLS